LNGNERTGARLKRSELAAIRRGFFCITVFGMLGTRLNGSRLSI
jgi:hypothetical protein